MDKVYDTIIIGAGHNGLVAAAYLARTGKRLLVLEQRESLGGTLCTQDLGGFQVDMIQSGTLRPDIARDLRLNLPAADKGAEFISLLPDGRRLVLGDDMARTSQSIRQFSEKDAERWPEFVRFMAQAARFLEKSYSTIIPSLPRLAMEGAIDLARLGLGLRLTGRKDMMNIIRALAMSAFELVEEYFESDIVRAAIASLGVHSITMGPQSAGTAFNLVHNWMNRGGMAHRYTGKAGAVTDALIEVIRKHGGEIRTNSRVTAILVDRYQCRGVKLENSDEIRAENFLSAVDPKSTFLSLVGPANLPPEFVWKVQSIKMRGSVAKIHLGLDTLPQGMEPGMTYVIAPSVRYLEKAFDAAKYGSISEQPYLELSTSANAASIHFQFAPYFLRDSNWQEACSRLERAAERTLAGYFPELLSRIRERKTLTPLDLEQEYGLTESDLNHGQLMLDQFFFMRPVPGYAGHKTPVDNLYLCGAGVHGGGGISGVSGRNAARVIMKSGFVPA